MKTKSIILLSDGIKKVSGLFFSIDIKKKSSNVIIYDSASISFTEALSILNKELDPTPDPVLAAPEYRRQLAVNLLYKVRK